MDKRLLFVVGFISGILIVASVFLPWATGEKGTGSWTRKIKDVSAWEMATGDVTFEEITKSQSVFPLIVLVGGVLALIGAICGLMIKTRPFGIPLVIGGILAIVGAFGGFEIPESIIRPYGGGNEFVTCAYGLFVCLIGGVFGTIAGGRILRWK